MGKTSSSSKPRTQARNVRRESKATSIKRSDQGTYKTKCSRCLRYITCLHTPRTHLTGEKGYNSGTRVALFCPPVYSFPAIHLKVHSHVSFTSYQCSRLIVTAWLFCMEEKRNPHYNICHLIWFMVCGLNWATLNASDSLKYSLVQNIPWQETTATVESLNLKFKFKFASSSHTAEKMQIPSQLPCNEKSHSNAHGRKYSFRIVTLPYCAANYW